MTTIWVFCPVCGDGEIAVEISGRSDRETNAGPESVAIDFRECGCALDAAAIAKIEKDALDAAAGR